MFKFFKMYFREVNPIVLTFFVVVFFFTPSINGLPVQRNDFSPRHTDRATDMTPSVKKAVIVSGLFIFLLALAGIFTLRLLGDGTNPNSDQPLSAAPFFNPRRLWNGIRDLLVGVLEAPWMTNVALEEVARPAPPSTQRPARAIPRTKITRPVAGIRPA